MFPFSSEPFAKENYNELRVDLRYHRPCGFAQAKLDERGRRQRRYLRQDYAAPSRSSAPCLKRTAILKDGVHWEILDAFAYTLSDTEAAQRMMRAEVQLLRQCKLESPFTARFEC